MRLSERGDGLSLQPKVARLAPVRARPPTFNGRPPRPLMGSGRLRALDDAEVMGERPLGEVSRFDGSSGLGLRSFASVGISDGGGA